MLAPDSLLRRMCFAQTRDAKLLYYATSILHTIQHSQGFLESAAYRHLVCGRTKAAMGLIEHVMEIRGNSLSEG
jgi:hypothetical protein